MHRSTSRSPSRPACASPPRSRASWFLPAARGWSTSVSRWSAGSSSRSPCGNAPVGVVPELAQSSMVHRRTPREGSPVGVGGAEPPAPGGASPGDSPTRPGERLVVQNTTDEEVDVLAQLVPFGGLEVMPEPFEITAPALRYGPVDLEADLRVPAQGYHSIDLEVGGSGSGGTGARSMSPPALMAGRRRRCARWWEPEPRHRPDCRSLPPTGWRRGCSAPEALDGTVFVQSGFRAAEITVTASVGADDGEPVRFEIPGRCRGGRPRLADRVLRCLSCNGPSTRPGCRATDRVPWRAGSRRSQRCRCWSPGGSRRPRRSSCPWRRSSSSWRSSSWRSSSPSS